MSSYSSKLIHPLSVKTDRRPSIELSRFSTTDFASDEGSTSSRRGSQHSSRRGSQQHDQDYPSSPVASIDFDNSHGTPPARQRTTQACDKCRDRKIKCSGDHPVCKRCTARGLICHYSERDRVRGPTKARLRNAMSSSSLDLRFAGGSESHLQGIKREEQEPSRLYALEYSPPPHSQYQHLAVPSRSGYPQYFEQGAHAGYHQATGPHALGPPLHSRMSLPQVTNPEGLHPDVPLQHHYVRRVQSHSALGASDAYRSPHEIPSFASRPISSPTAVQAASRLAPSFLVEYDMRRPNGHVRDYHDDAESAGSGPPSATDSMFSIESISPSESSESALRAPLSRSASELDLRMMSQTSQYLPQRLLMPHNDGKSGYHEGTPSYGFHSPAASTSPFYDGAHANVFVPQINGEFGNPWAPPVAREAARDGAGGR